MTAGPVVAAMAEEFFGVRIDHVAELDSDALGRVVDKLGGLQVYSRAAFNAGSIAVVEGTNNLDGATSAIFTAADPVDDAGQTRTRNQRAVLRARSFMAANQEGWSMALTRVLQFSDTSLPALTTIPS